MPNRKQRPSGFSLVEILVATSVLMMIVLVLASALNQALGVWGRSENKSDLRESARMAINIMGRELQQAVLPVYRKDQTSLQMVVNPPGLSSDFKHRDNIFWQAPIASSRTAGDLAIVGYFIRQDGNAFKLCRLFINPDDPAYAIYDGSGTWVTDAILEAKAKPDESNYLQGVFLENVPGMWITAYSDAVTKYTSDFDSRTAEKLPHHIEISLALLDSVGAQRVKDGVFTLPDARLYSSAQEFISNLNEKARPHVEAVTVSVPFPL